MQGPGAGVSGQRGYACSVLVLQARPEHLVLLPGWDRQRVDQGFACTALPGLSVRVRSWAGVGTQEAGVAALGDFPKQLPSASFFSFS